MNNNAIVQKLSPLTRSTQGLAGIGVRSAIRIDRRVPVQSIGATLSAPTCRGFEMCGLIGSFEAAPGRRLELVAILLGDVGAMPGCKCHAVADDLTDSDMPKPCPSSHRSANIVKSMSLAGTALECAESAMYSAMTSNP